MRTADKGCALIDQGEDREKVGVLLSGSAFRHQAFPDGKRQSHRNRSRAREGLLCQTRQCLQMRAMRDPNTVAFIYRKIGGQHIGFQLHL